jgi:hypothetical protein
VRLLDKISTVGVIPGKAAIPAHLTSSRKDQIMHGESFRYRTFLNVLIAIFLSSSFLNATAGETGTFYLRGGDVIIAEILSVRPFAVLVYLPSERLLSGQGFDRDLLKSSPGD